MSRRKSFSTLGKTDEKSFITIDILNQDLSKTNRISTSYCSLSTIVPKTLLELLSLPITYLFIFLISIQLSGHLEETSLNLYTIVPFSILVLFKLLENLSLSSAQNDYDSNLNEKIVPIFKESHFQLLESKNICRGDLVLLRAGQEVPADSLILASDAETSSIFFKQSQNTQGSSLLKKKSIRESQNLISHSGISLDQIKNMIQYVKVRKTSSLSSSEYCKIKLKDNPVIVYTESENFIESGSILVECDWILLLSVFVGDDLKKREKIAKIREKKNTDFDSFINILTVFAVIFYILLFLVTFFTGATFEHIDNKENQISLAFYILTLFAGVLPNNLYLIIFIQRFFSTLVLNHRFPNIQINNPRVLASLGKVEFMTTEIFGVLAKDLKPEVIFVQNTLYSNNQNYDSESQNGEENSESHSLSRNQTEYNDKTFKDFKDELFSEQNSEKMLFVACLIICNEFVSENSSNPSKSSDSVLLQLAASLGMKIREKTGKTFVLEFDSKSFTFSIIPSFKPDPRDSQAKMIIKDHQTGKIYLVHKLAFEDLNTDELVEEDQFHAENEISEFESLQRVLFLYKSLDSGEMEKIKTDYKSIFRSRVNLKYASNAVFNNYLEDMKVLGQVGIKLVVPQETSKTVKSLQKSGVKVWITTSEDEKTALNCARLTDLIEKDLKVLHFHRTMSKNQAQVLIESAIQSLFYSSPSYMPSGQEEKEAPSKYVDHLFTHNDFMSRWKSENHPGYEDIILNKEESKLGKIPSEALEKFAVVLDPSFLNMCLKSKYLLKGLVFLMVSAQSVLVHSSEPEDKMNVLKVLKNSLRYRPTTIAVGTEIDSFGMMTEADIRVKVSDDNYSNWFLNDVSVSNFAGLDKVLFYIGDSMFQSFLCTCSLFVVKEVSLVFMVFIYQSKCLFSACPFLGYDLLVMYEMGISFFYLFFIGFYYKAEEYSQNIEKQSKYLKKTIDLSKILLALAKYAVLGLVQGVLMVFFITLSAQPVSTREGETEDLESIQILTFIIITLKLLIEGVIFSKWSKKSLVLASIYFCLMMIILICVFNSKFEITYLKIQEFSVQPRLWLLLFAILVLSSLLFYLVQLLVSPFITKKINRMKEFKNIDKMFSSLLPLTKSAGQNDFDLDSFWMKFKEENVEHEYIELKKAVIFFRLKILLIILLLLGVINNILVELNQVGVLDLKRWTVIVTSLCLAMVLLTFLLFKEKSAYNLVLLIFLSVLILSLVETFINNIHPSSPRYPVFLVFNLLMLNTEWSKSLFQSLLIYILSILVTVYETFYQDSDSMSSFLPFWFILMLFLTLLVQITSYLSQKFQRHEYIFIKQAELQIEKTNTIISYLLPEFVRRRVQDGVRYIAEDKGTVSVIFCDVYDFESIVESYTPAELTDFLNDLFGRIDLLCEHFGITKIETVGKTYLACAGLKDSEVGIQSKILKNHHTRRAVEFALAIINLTQSITLKDEKKLQFKIGVNSGPVTAGVVGHHKPQFSLVGDTVNTASRMASTLKETNSVQISYETYEMMTDRSALVFEDRRREVKGKGHMDTKLVNYAQRGSSDDNTTDYFNRRSSIFSIISNPVLEDDGEKIVNKKNSRDRQSLLNTLGATTVGELFKKQTARRVNTIFDLICKETEAERSFRLNYLEIISKGNQIGLILSLLCECCLITVEVILYGLELKNKSLSRMLVSIFSAVFIGSMIALRSKYMRSIKFSLVLSGLFTLEFIGIFISESLRGKPDLITFMYFSYKFIMLNFYSGTLFMKNLVFNSITVSLWLVSTFTPPFTYPSVLYSTSFIIIVLCSIYLNENRMRVNTVLKNIAHKEVEKTQQLLTHMMPQNALNSLEQGKQVMDKLKHVTVMFADIVGFTAWSSIRRPKEVVNMLSEMFTRFDKTSVECNVYKVHTIGDCYVAMGYLNDKNRNPAKEAINMLQFACQLIRLINETNEKCGIQLGMRIGMHTGEITGGIIGTKIIRYDIYGIDVQIANKMESNGMAGKIALSETTKELIEDYAPDVYKFGYAKSIEVSGRVDEVDIYFYEGDY